MWKCVAFILVNSDDNSAFVVKFYEFFDDAADLSWVYTSSFFSVDVCDMLIS
jgi:hypothetical protein